MEKTAHKIVFIETPKSCRECRYSDKNGKCVRKECRYPAMRGR